MNQEKSMVLSLLLDEVVGTQDAISIRKDFGRFWEWIWNNCVYVNLPGYFTGSKGEGLYLPGSDVDFMFDMNHDFRTNVIRSMHEPSEIFFENIFLFVTENVPPGFALLQYTRAARNDSLLSEAAECINGMLYLSSHLFMEMALGTYKVLNPEYKSRIQGPSLERLAGVEYMDESECGVDNVHCFRCNFWPDGALEWRQRTRRFGWPTPTTISDIIGFGCHVVPVGHPHSPLRMFEWRISFSVAERTLVWSFNHIQMQCYAFMKLILKEYINVHVRPENRVLCSYFIKTYLFWMYESTDANFWREENIWDCITYLLIGFTECIREGVLRHYFYPKFNLLSVKLNREAQIELLQLFQQVIQLDMRILKECKTLCDVWSKFHNADNNSVRHIKRKEVLMTDESMMQLAIYGCQNWIRFNINYGIPVIARFVCGICQAA